MFFQMKAFAKLEWEETESERHALHTLCFAPSIISFLFQAEYILCSNALRDSRVLAKL